MSAEGSTPAGTPRRADIGGFLRLYLPIALVIAAVTAFIGVMAARSALENLKESQDDQVELGREIAATMLRPPVEQLRGMVREPGIDRAIRRDPSKTRSALEAQLATLLYRNPFYDQVRWLDNDGRELVRVRQGKERPEVVPREELLDRSDTLWFRGIARQPPGRIYISALDLSLAGHLPDSPPMPVIRFGVRLPKEGGRDLGVLVSNLRADAILERLRTIKRSIPGESIILLNANGYWLLGSEKNEAFSFALGDAENSFAKRQPVEWARISAQGAGQLLMPSGLWTWGTIDPAAAFEENIARAEAWKLVTHVPASTIRSMLWVRWWPLLLLATAALGVLVIAAYQYRKLWLQREETASEAALAAGKTAAERRLSLATEGADVGAWYWDVASNKMDWSEQCKKHLALPPGEEPDFEKFYAAMHPDDRERIRRSIDAAFKTRQDFREEYRIINPDGSLRWIAAPGRLYTKADGSPEAMSGLTIDITKLKQAEVSLRDLAANLEEKVVVRTAEAAKEREVAERRRLRLETVLDSLLDIQVLLCPLRDVGGKISDFVYVEANAAASSHAKTGRDELIGKSFLEFFPGTVSSGLFGMLCQVIETGQPLSLDDFRYADGKLTEARWFDIRGNKVEDMLNLTLRDVSERHLDAEKLAESQKQFRLLAENASDVVLKTDLEGNVTYVAPSSVTALGRQPGQLTGLRFRNIVHPAEWDAVESLEEQVRKGTAANMELRLRVCEAGYHWFSASMKPIVEENGTVSGCVVGLRDIRQEVQGREAIKAERERLRLTIDTLFDPLVLVQPLRDKDGKVTDFLYAEANSSACEWLQISREQLLGRSMLELFPAVESTGLMTFYRTTADGAAPSVIDEFPFPFRGTTRWLDIRGVRVDERVSFVWRDVTERHLAAEKLAASEERYRLLATNSSDVVVRLDENDNIVWVSPSLRGALGWETGDLIGRSVREFLGNSGTNETFEHSKESLEKGGSVACRITMRAKDGTYHWVELHAGPYRDREGKPAGVVGSFRVVDAEARAEEERLHQQEVIANERKHLADVIEGSDTGTWEWNVQTGETTYNEVWAKLIGYRLDELQPVSIATWERLTHPDDVVRAKAMLDKCFRRELEVYEIEARMRHRSGDWVWILTRGRVVEWNAGGKPLRMLGTHRDITATVKLREELENQATTDALTGLCNRRQFEKLAHRELSRAQRAKETPSLIMMDIDKFKSINDTFGHDAGDEVLKSMARACAPHLREVDVFARLGGEEFGLLLPETGLDGARSVAERIRETLAANAVRLDGGEPIRFTVSMGVAEWCGKPEELPGLMKRSDEALYRAKNEGRNRVCTA